MESAKTEKISFYKMQGSGNDFVLLLQRDLPFKTEQIQNLIAPICTRSFGVGADGLIILDTCSKKDSSHYRWHFFNADGSRAEMCGNGSRCAGNLAYRLGLAPANHVLETDVGQVRIRVNPKTEMVKVELTTPKDLINNIDLLLENNESIQIQYVNTGVPHSVVLTDEPEQFDLKRLGPKIRFHHRFAPQGTNVNVVKVESPSTLYIRTYERGVEDQTYACGTGAAASAFITYSLGMTTAESQVITSGGEHLFISIQDGKIYLEGKANLVYEGTLFLKGLGIE